ncbi:triacylglycerol lipase OBL1 [Henckelia pumila]|uniref:triacylglycerol lipase OBL1 n=1 Tax=Henckelia pumila TaxID=405737 RepID=UPI003C6E4EFF
MATAEENDASGSEAFGFLILRPENGGVLDLLRFLVFDNRECGAKFIERREFGEESLGVDGSTITLRDVGGVKPDHRWVIVVSIIVRKIIKVLGKPMEWIGYVVEFLLNLLSLNGNFMGLIRKILQGSVIMPKRGSETFISVIGHIDGRIDLYNIEMLPDAERKNWITDIGNRALMDLCMMASKLAYENAKVVRNVVNLHWKMHFVEFYNCWNDYQKERSTQVFIMCDKPIDANLILISFRGTEPFDADDWITDFDYSWYEIPKLGKVHMGFLEALGLGDRVNPSTFHQQLQEKGIYPTFTEEPNDAKKKLIPEMVEMTAYYAVRGKLHDLLKEHKNAQFVVTGHSLGGALAILFPTVLVLHEETELMQRLLAIYTYGQPRVGNRKLGRYMEAHLEHPGAKYFRVVYCNDLVPRLPYDNKTFLYKHFGICLYYDSLYNEQILTEEPNRNYFGMLFLIPEYLNAAWELFRSFILGCVLGPEYRESWESFLLRVVGLGLPGLSDHSPLDYVNSVRLGRLRSI